MSSGTFNSVWILASMDDPVTKEARRSATSPFDRNVNALIGNRKEVTRLYDPALEYEIEVLDQVHREIRKRGEETRRSHREVIDILSEVHAVVKRMEDKVSSH